MPCWRRSTACFTFWLGRVPGKISESPARLFRDAGRELTRPEYERLMETARSRGQERLALLMETICATGIRVSEVQYITMEAAKRGRTDIFLKGKIRTILLPEKLCRKLLKYAQKHKTASGKIFLTRSGRSLSRRQIWAEMKQLCRYAGVEPGKVFPHNFRHLFARSSTGPVRILFDWPMCWATAPSKPHAFI